MGKGMVEKDIDALIAWPHASICSDGSLDSLHPRGRGAFTKVLREYVREKKVLTLEEAIRKMTALSAANMGLADRGAIRPGAFADLVLFDPATVGDRSTFVDPAALSVGIETGLGQRRRCLAGRQGNRRASGPGAQEAMKRSLFALLAAASIAPAAPVHAAESPSPASAPRPLGFEDQEAVKYPGSPAISRDGKLLAFPLDKQIHVVPLAGGTPRAVTSAISSAWEPVLVERRKHAVLPLRPFRHPPVMEAPAGHVR